MEVGRQCPRIDQLGSLYPSMRLKTAVYDYYAAVIRLCKHSTEFLRRPGLSTDSFMLTAHDSRLPDYH